MEGFINVLKPPGMTSHDVVDRLRNITGLRKVGHSGTLDPLAAGTLLVALGRATRLIRFLPDNKVYRAEAKLGIATETGDAQGAVTQIKPLQKAVDWTQLQKTLKSFLGYSMQTPPMTSARKVKGKKLYELARQGLEVQRAARTVFISKLQFVDADLNCQEHPRLLLDTACSAGTYIRTLIMDIGKALGTVAFMSFLLRTRVGTFDIANSVTIEEIQQCMDSGNLQSLIIPIFDVLKHLPLVEVHPGAVKSVMAGHPLYPPGIIKGPVFGIKYARLCTADKQLLAVSELQFGEGYIRYKPQWVKGFSG